MKFGALFARCLFAAAVAMPVAAQQTVYTATLDGASEDVPNSSPGLGTATVTIDLDASTMRVQESFNGLLYDVEHSHIHCCTNVPGTGIAGVATTVPTFTDFPSGVTSGTYDHTFNMALASSYNQAFIDAKGDNVDANGNNVSDAFNALVAGLDAGTAYANIHTTQFPAGEIRGFLAPIPEPETYGMLLAGLAMISLMARRRRL